MKEPNFLISRFENSKRENFSKAHAPLSLDSRARVCPWSFTGCKIDSVRFYRPGARDYSDNTASQLRNA